MADPADVTIHGFRVEDASGVGIEAAVPLPGVTVLFGRNGAGKSLLIEYLDSLLAPAGEFRGRQTADSEMWAYGWLYLDPRPTGQWSAIAGWLSELARWAADDEELWGDVDPVDLAAALHRSGWQGLTGFLADGLEPDSAGWLIVRAVSALGVLAYQNFETGSLYLALPPRDAEGLRPVAEMVLAGTTGGGTPPADGTLAHRMATTIAEAPSGYVHLLRLMTMPQDRHTYDRLRAEHPTVAWIRDDPQELEQVIDDALPRERWQALEGTHGLVFDERVQELLGAIEQRANDIVPRFVQDHGRIALLPYRPAGRAVEPGVSVRFELAAEGRSVDYRHLGAGLRRWIGASVQVACLERGRRSLDVPPKRRERHLTLMPRIALLVDEPELHLHPAAQRDIADWLVQRNREGCLVLAASHSPALLDLPSDLASLVAIVRNEGQTTLYDMSADVLDAVDDLAGALGFDRHAWLYAVRGVLVVEGQHDMRVIRHFFGEELAAARVLPLPLRGSGNVMAMIEAEFLGRARVPMRVMFDHTAADAFRAGAMPDRARTPEERKLVQFLNQRRAGVDVEPIAYAEPDILCALPEDAVQRAYGGAKFDGWQTIIDDWTARRDNPGFKGYALKHMRIQDRPDEFLERVLLHVRPGEHPSGAVRQAIDTALASLTPS